MPGILSSAFARPECSKHCSVHEGHVSKPVAPTAASFIDAYFNPISQENFTNSINTNSVGAFLYHDFIHSSIN
jgi:hypothetical protein